MTIETTPALAARVDEISDDIIALRRELHRDPEIGLHLPRTQRRILDALDGLPLEITLGRELSSVVAVLRGGLPGPTVLLRGDMDGLPRRRREAAERRTSGVAGQRDLHVPAGRGGPWRRRADDRRGPAGRRRR